MNERAMQFRVGAMVLTTILATLILIMLFTSSNPLRSRAYTIFIKFKDAPGVTPYTPIRKDGIRIGKVRSVQFAPDDAGVIVTADIESNGHLYSDEQCKVTSPVLMGEAALDFVPIENFSGQRVPVGNDAVLEGTTAQGITGSIAGMQGKAEETLTLLGSTCRNVDKLATRVDHLVERNEQQITQTIGEAHETLKLMQQTLNASNEILGDANVRAEVKQTIREMPVVLEEMRTALKGINGTFTSLDRDLQDIERLTKPLGDIGPKLVGELDTSMTNVKEATGNLLQFSQQLNDPQGSLGALLHDRELYQHASHIAKNIDELTRDLKPILNDARVFTDKIARHPELLGVRGAIKKDAGLKDSLLNDGSETDVPETNRWPIGGSGRWSIGH